MISPPYGGLYVACDVKDMVLSKKPGARRYKPHPLEKKQKMRSSSRRLTSPLTAFLLEHTHTKNKNEEVDEGRKRRENEKNSPRVFRCVGCREQN
jgi:hypothetical protein